MTAPPQVSSEEPSRRNRLDHDAIARFCTVFAERRVASTRNSLFLPQYLTWLIGKVVRPGDEVLDVGGGTGFASYWALLQGARSVVCLEPMADGSNEKMLRVITSAQRTLDPNGRVVFRRETLEEHLSHSDRQFDTVMAINCINHFHEPHCSQLHTGDDEASAYFREVARSFSRAVRPGGTLVLADAGRSNFWADRRLQNPFAPTINWSIHQDPRTWAPIFEQAGFSVISVSWLTPWRLVSRQVEANDGFDAPLPSRFTFSSFTMSLRRM